MKIIVTKKELLELHSRCAEIPSSERCFEKCVFGKECGKAYTKFWRNNTEVVSDDGKTRI